MCLLVQSFQPKYGPKLALTAKGRINNIVKTTKNLTLGNWVKLYLKFENIYEMGLIFMKARYLTIVFYHTFPLIYFMRHGSLYSLSNVNYANNLILKNYWHNYYQNGYLLLEN